MFKSIKELVKMNYLNLQAKLFGIKPVKAVNELKRTLSTFNLARAPRSYRKSGIDCKVTDDGWYATYSITHLFATAYKNTFTSSVSFSRDRYYYKTKIFGKEREGLGPYVYHTTAKVTFGGLPIKDYVKTQAYLKQRYPQVNFYFNKDDVEVYINRTVKDLKEARAVLYEFNRIYNTIGDELVFKLNNMHDELHK